MGGRRVWFIVALFRGGPALGGTKVELPTSKETSRTTILKGPIVKLDSVWARGSGQVRRGWKSDAVVLARGWIHAFNQCLFRNELLSKHPR